MIRFFSLGPQIYVPNKYEIFALSLTLSLYLYVCVCVCVLKAYTASHASTMKVSIITIIIKIREAGACADRYVGEYESRLLTDGPHPSPSHPHPDNFPFSFLTRSYY